MNRQEAFFTSPPPPPSSSEGFPSRGFLLVLMILFFLLFFGWIRWELSEMKKDVLELRYRQTKDEYWIVTREQR
jgi:hypothetical protein